MTLSLKKILEQPRGEKTRKKRTSAPDWHFHTWGKKGVRKRGSGGTILGISVRYRRGFRTPQPRLGGAIWGKWGTEGEKLGDNDFVIQRTRSSGLREQEEFVRTRWAQKQALVEGTRVLGDSAFAATPCGSRGWGEKGGKKNCCAHSPTSNEPNRQEEKTVAAVVSRPRLRAGIEKRFAGMKCKN